ncbi:MAG: hypothetical protein V4577_29970 [Bacteroidota bacterium]
MMIKASALYMVIIIALVIGIICSSLVAVAYFYKQQSQKKSRFNALENNLGSGVNILLASADTAYSGGKTLSLFGGDADSVILKKTSWGLYTIGVVKSFIQKDTVFKVFSIASSIDSTKWAALYLADNDRPVSVSGKTVIRGEAFIPKAGIQTAYVDGKAYDGDKRLVIGGKHSSEKKLPALAETWLNQLQQFTSQETKGDSTLVGKDTIRQSFLTQTRYYNFKKKPLLLENTSISGNVVIYSDTTVTIDSTAALKNILIYARAIVVKSGFHGNCQLFAADSISVGSNCKFIYPSCLGVLRFKPAVKNIQEKIIIGEKTVINGVIFTYEKEEKPIPPIISIGKNATVKGQIYAQGQLELNDKSEIDGSAFTSTFLYKNAFTRFENYLINTTINSKALSPYYLTSTLTPVSGKSKKVLQWLEAN